MNGLLLGEKDEKGDGDVVSVELVPRDA